MAVAMKKLYGLSIIVLSSRLGLVCPQATRTEPFPLVQTTNLINCTELIQTHSISGTCCSLKDSGSGGCTVTVIDGTCRVDGDAMFINYQSTDETTDCPDGDYIVTDPPTMMPVAMPTPEPAPTAEPETSPSTAARNIRIMPSFLLLFPLLLSRLLL